MQWDVFEGKQHRASARTEPRVTLGAKGTFYLNGAAYEALRSPAAVEMMYDSNERVIGIKPIDPQRRNAFVVKHHGSGGSYKRISAAAFCRHFRIDTRDTVLFEEPDLDNDGVMRLDRARTIRVTRGAR